MWIITDVAFLVAAVLGMFVRLLMGPTRFKGSIWKGMLVTCEYLIPSSAKLTDPI